MAAGQLSQVIYLHNLQFKQIVPPNKVEDWLDESVAGPISAFLQLITDLEIWLQDADDPLGLLRDTMQIRRPLDQNRPSNDTNEATDPEIPVDLVQKVTFWGCLHSCVHLACSTLVLTSKVHVKILVPLPSPPTGPPYWAPVGLWGCGALPGPCGAVGPSRRVWGWVGFNKTKTNRH